ncbi:MAG: DoxX family protein [Ilumatobacteraceae bacterium]
MLLVVLAVTSALAFGYYGITTLIAHPRRAGYERYGLAHLRVLIGAAELFGAAGVIIGLSVSPLGAVAALGLTAMMMLGLIARWRIDDALRHMIPAAILGALNGVLVYLFLSG